jgi:hypothetical protein
MDKRHGLKKPIPIGKGRNSYAGLCKMSTCSYSVSYVTKSTLRRMFKEHAKNRPCPHLKTRKGSGYLCCRGRNVYKVRFVRCRSCDKTMDIWTEFLRKATSMDANLPPIPPKPKA